MEGGRWSKKAKFVNVVCERPLTVRPRYQAIPISANFDRKLFSIVSKYTH